MTFRYRMKVSLELSLIWPDRDDVGWRERLLGLPAPDSESVYQCHSSVIEPRGCDSETAVMGRAGVRQLKVDPGERPDREWGDARRPNQIGKPLIFKQFQVG